MNCALCNVVMKYGVKCGLCKLHLDFHCAGITEAEYTVLSNNQKDLWKCAKCKFSSMTLDINSLEGFFEEFHSLKRQLCNLPSLSEIKCVRSELAELRASCSYYKERLDEHSLRLSRVEDLSRSEDVYSQANDKGQKESNFRRVLPTEEHWSRLNNVGATFGNGKQAELGNELPSELIQDMPNMRWNADPDSFYTLIETCPDSKTSEWLYWLVVNIPGDDVSAGDTVVPYISPRPSNGFGLKRYVILVYKQPAKLNFDEYRVHDKYASAGRLNFSTQRFASKYKLGDAYAGNYFVARCAQ